MEARRPQQRARRPAPRSASQMRSDATAPPQGVEAVAAAATRAAEMTYDAIADDTLLKYVRCCDKCACAVDTRLKAAMRRRQNVASFDETQREENSEDEDLDEVDV